MQQPRLRPINLTTAEQSASIRGIEPAVSAQPFDDGTVPWPCELELVDGRRLRRAYCRVNARYSDSGDWVAPDQVVAIRESGERLCLPGELAARLRSAGESGMGYLIFELRFRGMPPLACQIGNDLLIDFLRMPDGYQIKDVLDVAPHEGRERANADGFCTNVVDGVVDFVFHDDPRFVGV